MKLLLLLIFTVSVVVANDEFTRANNLFTPSIYKEILKKEKDNFLVSPFSIETALAFTQSGCKGETAQEIRNALHLPNDNTKIQADFKTLLPKLKGNDSYTLHVANKMYIKDNFSVKDEFKKVAVDIFSASSESIDFSKKIEAAKVMNDWVEKQTENRIKNLIESDELTDDTRVILINALYFKANWSTPFLLSNTKKLKFYKTPSDVFEVDAMRNRHLQYFSYYECAHLNAKFLELQFKGNESSMTFVLPKEKDGLAALESQIDRVFHPCNFTDEWVIVALPKFRIESKIDLKAILKNMGVNLLFKDFEADLSGVAGNKGDLVVSDVIQKSLIDINEEGVEAAAAKYIRVRIPMMGILDPKEFIADHPFIFYIKVKGVIIFAGRVTEPTR